MYPIHNPEDSSYPRPCLGADSTNKTLGNPDYLSSKLLAAGSTPAWPGTPGREAALELI